MKNSMTMRVGQRGVVTLPQSVRETYGLQPGAELAMIDLGGSLLVTPKASEIDTIADRLSSRFKGEDRTLEAMLKTVREERERYGQED